MNTINISDKTQRLTGQQLCSVLVAIDYVTLKFVKYPLLHEGRFSDCADIDIEEGFELSNGEDNFIIRKNDGLKEFQLGASRLIAFIGQYVINVESFPSGELILMFDRGSVRLLLSECGFDSFDVNFPNC